MHLFHELQSRTPASFSVDSTAPCHACQGLVCAYMHLLSICCGSPAFRQASIHNESGTLQMVTSTGLTGDSGSPASLSCTCRHLWWISPGHWDPACPSLPPPTAKADYKAPGKGTPRHQKAKRELVAKCPSCKCHHVQVQETWHDLCPFRPPAISILNPTILIFPPTPPTQLMPLHCLQPAILPLLFGPCLPHAQCVF